MDRGKGAGEDYQEWISVEGTDYEGAPGSLLGYGIESMSRFVVGYTSIYI